MDYVVARELNGLYIILDIMFLVLLGFLLLKLKRRLAFSFGVAGAILYFIVDFGIFNLLLHTRVVTGASAFWFLLWLSTSYGFTNFVWIWLFLNKDKQILEWSLLIVIGWFAVALISQSFGADFVHISISRGTGSYHGAMAIILFIGYAYAIIRNLTTKGEKPFPILKMLLIGILVQFSWEAILLVGGIRPEGWNPLIINSLLETNLGIPYLFLIHKAIVKHRREDGSRILSEDRDASITDETLQTETA